MLDDRVAAAQRGGRGQGQQPGPGVGDVVPGPVQPEAIARRPRPASAATCSWRRSISAAGLASAGPGGDRAQPGRLPARAGPPAPARPVAQPAISASCSATSGTTRRAASVGVDARTSATRSSSGASCSCPIALTTGVRQRGDRADQRLVGERQQVLHRPAAAGDDDHVHAGSASSRCSASMISPPRRGPGRRPAPPGTAPRASAVAAFRSTSRSAAESRPQIRPTTCGRNGSGRLRSAANRPSAASAAQPLQPGQQLADAHGAELQGGQRERAPRGLKSGLAQMTTPGALGGRRGRGVQHRAAGRSPAPTRRRPGPAGSGTRSRRAGSARRSGLRPRSGPGGRPTRRPAAARSGPGPAIRPTSPAAWQHPACVSGCHPADSSFAMRRSNMPRHCPGARRGPARSRAGPQLARHRARAAGPAARRSVSPS